MGFVLFATIGQDRNQLLDYVVKNSLLTNVLSCLNLVIKLACSRNCFWKQEFDEWLRNKDPRHFIGSNDVVLTIKNIFKQKQGNFIGLKMFEYWASDMAPAQLGLQVIHDKLNECLVLGTP